MYFREAKRREAPLKALLVAQGQNGNDPQMAVPHCIASSERGATPFKGVLSPLG
jgi:hypothetical protein